MKFFSVSLLLFPLLSQVEASTAPHLAARHLRLGSRAGRNGRNGGNNNNTASSTSTSAAANASATAGAGTGANNNDPQTSLTLDPAVIATGFQQNGQQGAAVAGQVPSLTSSNNFINFCLTVPNLPITNGKQVATGSCNPAPMGVIPASTNMPSSKFTNPPNGGSVPANTAFTITMAISNLETGNFVNAQANYFSAPQQLNAQGVIVGHSHVVVEPLSSLGQTTITDPTKFAFFKGLNAAAVNGVLSADVANGLPAGAYRLCSINTAANHQPALVPIAQHGSLDDCVYFTATDGAAAGNAPAAGTGAAAPATVSTSPVVAAASVSSTAVAAGAATASESSTTVAAGAATASESSTTVAAGAATASESSTAVAAGNATADVSSTAVAAGNATVTASGNATASTSATGSGGKRGGRQRGDRRSLANDVI